MVFFISKTFRDTERVLVYFHTVVVAEVESGGEKYFEMNLEINMTFEIRIEFVKILNQWAMSFSMEASL